ncbi:class I SAM-dependent methyltransferase [bacterium]|nr:class I SAM-dependent methyltransferase [bacterium]
MKPLVLGAALLLLGAAAHADHHDTHGGGDSGGHDAKGHAEGHAEGHDAHGAAEHGHADHHGDDATMTHRFEDADAWARRFEDPARDEWQLPGQVVAELVDRDDLVIADIGSATGYFPVRFARAVPRGQVIGADIEPGMVTYLNDRARAEGLTNLVSVLAGTDDPHLPRTVDLVFFCDTIHHIDGRVAYLEGLRRSLRPGGRIAVVDFRPESERGPDHKLDPVQLVSEFKRAGYRLRADFDFLPDQYFLIFTPAS